MCLKTNILNCMEHIPQLLGVLWPCYVIPVRWGISFDNTAVFMDYCLTRIFVCKILRHLKPLIFHLEQKEN